MLDIVDAGSLGATNVSNIVAQAGGRKLAIGAVADGFECILAIHHRFWQRKHYTSCAWLAGWLAGWVSGLLAF